MLFASCTDYTVNHYSTGWLPTR